MQFSVQGYPVTLLWALLACAGLRVAVEGVKMTIKPYEWRTLQPRDQNSNSSMPTTHYTDSDWPLFRGKERQLACEVCQSMVLVAQRELSKKVRKNQPTGLTRSFGDYDVAVETLVTSKEGLCGLKKWDWVADRTEVYTSADMKLICKSLLEEKTSDFVDALILQKDFVETAKRVCVNPDGQAACAASEIWDADDMPANREVKSSRYARMSEEFLKTNAKREGVKVTESGLQYERISEADEPIGDDVTTVKIHYNATFMNGVSFDDTSKYDGPVEVSLDLGEYNEVIKGLSEGIKLAGVGGEVILAIPPHLGYGEQGAGRMVPPNSLVLYRVKVVEIVGRKTSESKEGEEERADEEEGGKVEKDDSEGNTEAKDEAGLDKEEGLDEVDEEEGLDGELFDEEYVSDDEESYEYTESSLDETEEEAPAASRQKDEF